MALSDSYLAIVLRDFHAPYGIGDICPVHEGMAQGFDMGLAPRKQFLDLYPINSAFSFVTHHLIIGGAQVGQVDYLFHEVIHPKVRFHKFAFDYLHVGLHSPYPSDAVLSLCGQPCALDDVFCILSCIE